MRVPTLVLALLVIGAVGGDCARRAGAAETHFVPSWMTVDAASKTVTMDVIAGFNPNNSNWNYNGYHDGDMTVILPQGWNVRMTFTNQDADVPHSLVVMTDVGPANLPFQAGREQAAFPRAYTKSPEQGLSAGEHDVIAFKANKAGKFLWICGVAGHAQSGMWTHLEISAEAATPYLRIAKKAEAGRP
jgi:sulfocyanin